MATAAVSCKLIIRSRQKPATCPHSWTCAWRNPQNFWDLLREFVLSQVGLEQQFGMLTEHVFDMWPVIQQSPEGQKGSRRSHFLLRRKLRAMIRWTFSDASFLKTGWAWFLVGLAWLRTDPNGFQLPNQIQQMVEPDAIKVEFTSNYPNLGKNEQWPVFLVKVLAKRNKRNSRILAIECITIKRPHIPGSRWSCNPQMSRIPPEHLPLPHFSPCPRS